MNWMRALVPTGAWLLLPVLAAPAPRFHPRCGGCRISQGLDPVTQQAGGVIELKGGWMLNVYGGSEGFHGWMVLQPKAHRMDWEDLDPEEAAAVGPRIQEVTAALKAYWASAFPDDPLQRVHVLYFHETVFGTRQTLQPSQDWHLHIHLVPRSYRLGAILRNPAGHVDVWRLSRVTQQNDLPPTYFRTTEKSLKLMAFLRERLGRP